MKGLTRLFFFAVLILIVFFGQAISLYTDWLWFQERSEERRVGKESRTWWSPYQKKKIRRRNTKGNCDWSSDVCSSDLFLRCFNSYRVFRPGDFSLHRLALVSG